MPNGQGIIDEVLGPSVITEVAMLESALKSLRAEYKGTVKDIAGGMATLANATGVKGVTEAVEKQNKALDELSKTKEQILKYEEKINASLTLEAQLLARQKLEYQRATQDNKNYAKSTQAAAGSIDEMEAKLAMLLKQIKAVGDAEGQGAAKVQMLTEQYNKLDAVVRKHNENMGNFSKSVGNYAKGFSGMNLAVGQLARELPNAAISLQTFLVSISNNVGGLQDAVAGLKKQNVELAEQGKAQIPIFSSIVNAIVSWQTAVMLLVTAAIYFIPKMLKVNDAISESEQIQKRANEAFKSGLETGAKELVQLEQKYRALTDANIPLKERTLLLEDIKKQYPGYFEGLKEEDFLVGKATSAYEKLNTAILNASIGRAFAAQAEELGKDLPKLMLMFDELSKRYNEGITGKGDGKDVFKYSQADREKESERTKKLLEEMKALPGIGEEIYQQLIQGGGGYSTMLRSAMGAVSGQIENIRGQMTALLSKANEFKTTFTGSKSGGKKDRAAADKNGEGVAFSPFAMDDLQLMEKAYRDRLAWYEKVLGEWVDSPSLQEVLKLGLEFNVEEPLSDEEADRLRLELKKHFDEKRNQIQLKIDSDEMKKNIMSAIDTVSDALGKIGDAFAAAIRNSANAKAEEEKRLIDENEQYELDSLSRRTLSAKQKESEQKRIEAEADYRRRKSEAERLKALRKAAAIEKAITISQIVASTALAVMRALEEKNIPYYLKVVNAVSAGAVGAAQLTAAIATPLPEYAKGRKGGKAEFAIVNEKGPETVVTKEGKAYIPLGGKKGITFLPDGASVIPAPERVKNAAFVPLGTGHSTVTEGIYAEAAIAAYRESASTIEKAIKKQKFNVIISSDLAANMRYQSRIL